MHFFFLPNTLHIPQLTYLYLLFNMMYVEEVRMTTAVLEAILSDTHGNFGSCLLNNYFLLYTTKNICTFQRRSELVPHHPTIPVINEV